jgi:hypothetical protein
MTPALLDFLNIVAKRLGEIEAADLICGRLPPMAFHERHFSAKVRTDRDDIILIHQRRSL